MRVALYGRISTAQQETENQMAILRDYCRKQEYEITSEYIDVITGGTAEREQFQKMFEDARTRKFDLVMFWALDRFSREGVLETLNHLKLLNTFGVDWRSYSEQYLDSTGIFREAIIAILAALAKQEKIRIRERTMAGLDRARKNGKILGRKPQVFDRKAAIEMREAGLSLSHIAAILGVSKPTIYRVCKGVTVREEAQL